MEFSFSVGTPMTSSQTSSLLEAGFTFILYQRGQIPMPFQQLQTSVVEMQLQNLSGRSKSKALLSVESPELDDLEVADCVKKMNPRQRIALMNQERKKRVQLLKLDKQRKVGIAAESKAYHSIQPAIEILRRLLADVTARKPELTPFGHRKRILSLALLLGPSVYCPKEIYYFDLPCHWISDDSNKISKAGVEQFQTTILRQFYKKIITSTDFMDFTTKALGIQYVHLCVVALGDLNSTLQDEYYNNVLRLPALPPSIQQALSRQVGDTLDTEPSTSSVPIYFSRKNRNKCFKIRIQSPSLEAESIEDNSCDCTNSSFSSDILFDSNSFSCYQIPLRFKGVQCKNKRL